MKSFSLLLATLPCLIAAQPVSKNNGTTTTALNFFSPSTRWAPLPLTGDEDFDFQLYFAMDLAAGRHSAVGDILTAAPHIKAGDFESFANVLWTLANQTNALASQIGHSNPLTARDSFFAASTYYRLADFYLHANPKDPRLAQLWANELQAFGKALPYLGDGIQGRRIHIPTDHGFSVPAYYYSQGNTARPTIIVGTGYDGPQEDFLPWLAFDALEHGWNVITYEGPGQPTVIHEQGVGFINEWEKVVSPVVDWLEKEPTACLDKLTLWGFSMGGYLNARAAAFEPRIKALMLNTPMFSLYDTYFTQNVPQSLVELYETDKPKFDEYFLSLAHNTSTPTAFRWAITQGLYTFDTTSPSDWITQLIPYNMTEFVPKLTMPTLLVNDTTDMFVKGDANYLAGLLKKQGTRVTEVKIGGVGGQHDQPGASLEFNRLVWPWMDSVWGKSA